MEREADSGTVPAAFEQIEVGSGRWTWHRGPLTGAAVVFDLDGVLSDAAARQHYLKGPRPDWEAFFSASAEDPLIDEVATLLGLLSKELAIVLLTARPARTGALTVDWLTRYELRWDLLVMRRDDDYRPARAVQTRGGPRHAAPAAST